MNIIGIAGWVSKPSSDYLEEDGVYYFRSYYDAKEYLKAWRDNFKQLKVIEHKGKGYAIEIFPGGPYIGGRIK